VGRELTFFQIISCLLWGLIAIIAGPIDCRSAPPHPPTFADFREAFRRDSKDTNGMDAQVEVFSAAQLSNDELQTILSRGKAEELIGAGIQAPIKDFQGTALLVRSTEVSSTNPVAWAALAYRNYSLLANKSGDFRSTAAQLAKAIEKLQSIDASNSMPLYLEAAFQCLQTNYGAARQSLLKSAEAIEFENYVTAMKKCVIVANESVGYPKYTARTVAIGNDHAFVVVAALNKAILRKFPDDEAVAHACLVLGQRESNGRSFLQELVGNSIQLNAIEKLPGRDFTTTKEAIAARKARIKLAVEYLNRLKTGNVSEARWVKYFDESIEKGEMTAVGSLASDNGDSF